MIRLTKKQHADMIRMYIDEEMSVREVARAVRASKFVITRSLLVAGVQIRPCGWRKGRTKDRILREGINNAVSMYKEGIPGDAISEFIGVSRSTVYKNIKAAGVTMRPRGWRCPHTWPEMVAIAAKYGYANPLKKL